MSSSELHIESWRGTCVESVHVVDAVAVDHTGEVVLSLGDPTRAVTWRSAAKPFQLQVSLNALPDELVARLRDQDIALGLASHTAEPNHLKTLEVLSKELRVDFEELQCGAHPPINLGAHQSYLRAGEHITAQHNNCSGKHLFMLGACHAHFGSPKEYLSPEHPLQRTILQLLNRFGTIETTVIDGCGAPCFVSDLKVLAQVWGTLKDIDSPALTRIRKAMLSQPWYYSGSERLDYQLASEGRGLLTKVGAAGLIAGILLDKGISFAIKIRDGSDAARPLAAHEVLRKLGHVRSHNETLVRQNVSGTPVGHWEARWQ